MTNSKMIVIFSLIFGQCVYCARAASGSRRMFSHVGSPGVVSGLRSPINGTKKLLEEV